MAKKTGNVVEILKNQKAFLEAEKLRIEKELQKLESALQILDTDGDRMIAGLRKKKSEMAV